MLDLTQEQHLGKKALILFTIQKSRWAFVILAVTLAASILRDIFASALLSQIVSTLSLITILAFALNIFMSWLEYRVYTFSLGEFDLKMKSGLVSKKEVSIPYRQIQSVDIVRSVTHQLFGLSKLTMLTGGHEEQGEEHMSEVVLEPIDKKVAEEIRDTLEKKIGVQVVANENQIK